MRHSVLGVSFATALAVLIACAGWVLSGSLYLDLGTSFLGNSLIGVGFFQNSIYYSSVITFVVTFCIVYYGSAQMQRKNPLLSLVLSALVVLSAAYVFEFVYEWFNAQNLVKYVGQVHWWVDLSLGVGIAFGLNMIRVSRASKLLFAGFVAAFALWYLSGYNQVAQVDGHLILVSNVSMKLIPRLDSIGWAFALNAVSKALICGCVASLFLHEDTWVDNTRQTG